MTRATFPSRENSFFISVVVSPFSVPSLFQLGSGNYVYVVEGLVRAAHGSDEVQLAVPALTRLNWLMTRLLEVAASPRGF